MKRYGTEWYARRIERARESARVVLPLVFEVIRPMSIADVGCGTGSWLHVARELGVLEVVGIDAAHVDVDLLEIHREEFVTRDLKQPVDLGRTFDLALCLEVGEHIPDTSAGTLIKTVTGLAPAVLFSAAIPGQGGTAHVNEQWPEYWARRFLEYGYCGYDFVRPLIWCDPRVRYFYAQNSVLYIHEADASRYPALPGGTRGAPLPLVHPRLLERVRGAVPPSEMITASVAAQFAQQAAQRARAGVQGWRARRR